MEQASWRSPTDLHFLKTVILWIALPIFWGSVWLLLRYFNQLTVTVVDFESPLLGEDAALGPLMVTMARETNVWKTPIIYIVWCMS